MWWTSQGGLKGGVDVPQQAHPAVEEDERARDDDDHKLDYRDCLDLHTATHPAHVHS